MYHTSVVFLVAAALLLPPELIVLIPLVQTVPEWLKERYPWPIQGFNISNYTLDSLAAWGTADLVNHHGERLIGESRGALCGRGPRRRSRLRRGEPRAGRDHHEARPRAQLPRKRPVRRRVDLGRPRADDPRRLARGVLELEPVAHLRGARAARRRPPLAQRPAAPGGGARRSEDGPLQRALLRDDACRRARPRGALRTADVADHGRPRPAARHQQQLRPPRRRRGPEGHRGDLPRRAAPLRRSRAVRRRGVLDPPAGDAAGAGDGDR